MGLKKKWIENAKVDSSSHLESITEILKPFFSQNGTVDLGKIENQIEDLSVLFAFLSNSQLLLSNNKELRQFGADDIMPIQIQIEMNSILKYWGKIYWLSIPKNHKTYRSQLKDPFYCELELSNGSLKIKQMLFGDYDASNLDSVTWIKENIEWMFEI